MNIESLHYLEVIASSSSLSKAAKKIHISQQGLSKALKSLEAELGYPLIRATPRGITMTDFGKIAVKHAKKIAREMDSLESELSECAEKRQSLDAKGIKMNASLICVLTIIRHLQERGYLKDLVLRQVESLGALGFADEPGWLSLIDVPIGTDLERAVRQRFEVISLFTAKIGVVARKDAFGLEGKGEKLTTEDVAGLPLGLADTETTRILYDAIFGDTDLENVKLFTTSESGLMSGVADGRFAAMLLPQQWDRFISQTSEPELFAFFEIESSVALRFVIAYPKECPLSEGQEAFIGHFTKLLADEGLQ